VPARSTQSTPAHEVDQAIVLADVQRQFGIACEKSGQRRHHEVPGQRPLQIHAQLALGRRVSERAFGLLHVRQQPHAAAVVGLAVLREAHGAVVRSAVAVDALFHALDQRGDGGAESAGRRGWVKLWRSAIRTKARISWNGPSCELRLLFTQLECVGDYR
jgi:hypothetical protein